MRAKFDITMFAEMEAAPPPPALDLLFPAFNNDIFLSLASGAVFSDAGVTQAIADGDSVQLVNLDNLAQKEVVVNGGFAADTDFTKGVGWSIANGKAVASGAMPDSRLDQDFAFTAGATYRIEFTVSEYVSGVFVLDIPGGIQTPGAVGNGTYAYTYVMPTNAIKFGLRGTGNVDAKFDDLSILEIVPRKFEQLDAGKRPFLRLGPNGVNDRWLGLDGSTQTMTGAADLNFGQGSFWACIPIKNLAANYQCIMGKANNAVADNIRFMMTPAGQLYTHHGGGGGGRYVFSTGVAALNQPNILEWGVDAETNESFYAINGVEERAAATISGTGNNNSNWYLGQTTQGDSGQPLWFGHEAALVSHMPDAATRLTHRQRLAANHGIVLS